MGVFAIHRKPTDPPINNTGDYCRAGCWTPPGREHGLACPAVDHHDGLRFFRGLLNGVLLGALAWLPIIAVAFVLIRSL